MPVTPWFCSNTYGPNFARRDEFYSLLALAQGRQGDADPTYLKPLRDQGLLDESGAVLPIVRSILGAYTVTAEGPVITDPFRPRSEAEKQAGERAAEQNDQTLLNWLLGPGGGGRSR